MCSASSNILESVVLKLSVGSHPAFITVKKDYSVFYLLINEQGCTKTPKADTGRAAGKVDRSNDHRYSFVPRVKRDVKVDLFAY